LPDWITITGVAPWDGRYEFDVDEQPLTTREWAWIKKHAGYLPLTLTADALADPEFVIVEAVIALHRAGKITTTDVPDLVERFQDVDPFATLTYERGATVEDDAGPPPESSDVRPSTNGASSATGSASLADPLTPTGHPRSDTSPSAPAMSET
jgi:hypothetical protein